MRYIDQEKIYDLTEQGLTIFQHYFHSDDIRDGKKFLKARKEEKTASAKITWYKGYWRITDFGNQSELAGAKAIEFVMWIETLPYYDALIFIEQVIIRKEIDDKKFVKSQFSPGYSYREMIAEDKKGEYNFTFKEHPTKEDLAAIGRYVTEDHLNYYFCKTIEQYDYCGNHKKLNRDVVHTFKATSLYPIFLFDYGKFKKLYRPHDLDKKNRFIYIGSKPKNYVYGLDQILKVENQFFDAELEKPKQPEGKPDARITDIFRCSGESDALNLFSLGFHPYWLNSESADLDYPTFKLIDDLADNHYQVMDLDNTGREEALKNALKHINLYTIELPSWLKYKKDWRGNLCKDLKDFINLSGDNEDQTRYDLDDLKRAARKVKFWTRNIDEKTNKVNYGINMEFLFFFLSANGFYQMESVYHKKAGYCYVHIEGRIVELIHPDDIKRRIKRFIKEWIKGKKLMDALEILNKINTSNQITEANIETIDSIKLNFKNHDRYTEYIHFRNSSLKIIKDKIEKVKHSEIPNYILGSLDVNNTKLSHVLDHEIRVQDKPPFEVTATEQYAALLETLRACKTEEERTATNRAITEMSDLDKYLVKINDEDFIFLRFLRDLSRIHWRKKDEQKKELTEEEEKEENLALANILFVLGYNCAQYKDPGKPWLTFLQDMKVSDVGTAAGRSGKSLLSTAISFVRLRFYKGGKTLNDKNVYQFFYDGYTEFHDFIEIDDMHEYAEFGFFYTQVTGQREINPKNYSAFTLPYENSGKMLISSNYELQNLDSSTVGRLLNCGVSDYYHEKSKFNDYLESRSPLIKFGKRLYDDFTEEEWVKFYNVIACCIQLQMNFFKIQPPAGNLDKRQLRRAMSMGLGKDEEFFKWANDYFCYAEKVTPDYSPPEHGYFNSYIYRENPFESFQSTLTAKQKNEYKSTKFKRHLEAWCEYWGHTLNPLTLCTDKEGRRILKTIDNRTRELFYISTIPQEMVEKFINVVTEPHNPDTIPF